MQANSPCRAEPLAKIVFAPLKSTLGLLLILPIAANIHLRYRVFKRILARLPCASLEGHLQSELHLPRIRLRGRNLARSCTGNTVCSREHRTVWQAEAGMVKKV